MMLITGSSREQVCKLTGASERVGELKKWMHGSTFGGNALACAVGRATIEYMEKENLVQRAEEMGAYFMERLRMIDSDKIREVRGMGLIAIVNRQ